MACLIYVVEEAVVAFRFVDGGTEHSLPWTELLTKDETPFESYEQLSMGLCLLAPWYSGKDSANIQFAEAEIIGIEKEVPKGLAPVGKDPGADKQQLTSNPTVKVNSKCQSKVNRQVLA